MKDFLTKLINDKQAKISEIRAKVNSSESVDEVRALTAEAESIQKEIRHSFVPSRQKRLRLLRLALPFLLTQSS